MTQSVAAKSMMLETYRTYYKACLWQRREVLTVYEGIGGR